MTEMFRFVHFLIQINFIQPKPQNCTTNVTKLQILIAVYG